MHPGTERVMTVDDNVGNEAPIDATNEQESVSEGEISLISMESCENTSFQKMIHDHV
jgi:hypothetical protein